MTRKIDSSIFREYDIRGEVGKTLFEDDAYNIGRAFATYVLKGAKSDKIVTCYDGRISSPAIEKRLVDGIKSTGADVIRIGMGPTPMLYFAVYQSDAAGGIMVTGSHNPKNHNGFKMMRGKTSLYGQNIKEIEKMINANDFKVGKGEVQSVDYEKQYIKTLAQSYKSQKSMKIAWDPGNGAAGNIVSKITKLIPGDHYVMNETVDGNFPNHHPDPTVPKNLEQIIKHVQANACDFGVAFDGDGDRIGVVDNLGRILWGDQLLLILAKDLLKRKPGSKIIADVKASQVLFDEVKRAGGQPIMWKTGHSLVKAKMLETKTELAGEMSGHIFIADDYFGFDDGIFAAIRLINIIAESGRKLSSLIDEMPQTFNTPEIRINCEDDRKFKVIDNIKNSLKLRNVEFSDIDGVRVSSPEGWWLIRASNTQPAIVARCESSSKAGLDKVKMKLSRQLEEQGLNLNDVAAH